ncbi:hypothetical protein ACTRXD_04855 [Nitrospira sp. T9]|uniref:hypothetical protein n=1 Tax=unclassified Nitrospira TaxID=2652172 RepID=UPI003F9DA8F8
MWNKLIEIAQNPITTLALSLISILLAVILYGKSRRVKDPKYYVESNTIIEGLETELDEIEVRFKGIPQTRLTRSLIFFWNAGKGTIDRDDLVPLDPLRLIVPSNTKLLDARVVKTSSPSNEFGIVKVNQEVGENHEGGVILDFHYLDLEEGGVIQLIHTGNRQTKIQMKGKIKGVKALGITLPIARILYNTSPYLLKVIMRSRLYAWQTSLFYSFFGVYLLVTPIISDVAWYVALLAPFFFFVAWLIHFMFVSSRLPHHLTEV